MFQVNKYYCKTSHQYKVSDTDIAEYIDDKLIKCTTCVEFIPKNMYINHKKTCRNQFKYCLVCEHRFTTELAYIKHRSDCMSPQKCHFCPTVFTSKRTMAYHLRMVHHVHSKQALNNSSTSCSQNQNTYQGQRIVNLLQHKDWFAKENLVVHCNTCSVDIHYEEYFKQHLVKCFKNEKFTCPLCVRAKSTIKVGIYEHIEHHIKESKVTKCPTCTASFLSDINMKVHESRNHVALLPVPTIYKYRSKYKTKKTAENISKPTVTGLIKVRDLKSLQEPAPTIQNIPTKELLKKSEITDITSAVLEKYRYDIKNYLIFLKTESLLSDNVSVYCSTCSMVYSIETYWMHVLTCLQKEQFECPCCSSCDRSNYSIEFCLQHIKLHFTNAKSQSQCGMCTENFFNDHNMAIHAQYDHFL